MIDGHIVYQGTAANSYIYFQLIKYPMNKFMNPADHFLKVLQVNYPKKEEDNRKIDYLK